MVDDQIGLRGSCIIPCKPILDWQKEQTREMKELKACIKEKTSQKQFRWIIGALCFFVVVIIGGAQWGIVHNMSLISSEVKVVATAITGLKGSVDYHIRIDDLRQTRTEERMERLNDKIHEEHKRDGRK